MADVASIYSKFRGSRTFLVGLVTFVAAWLTIHFIHHQFDPDFGELNTLLSMEASISLAFFTMVADKQAQRDAEQAAVNEQVLKQTHAIGTATLAAVEAVRDVVQALYDGKEQQHDPR